MIDGVGKYYCSAQRKFFNVEDRMYMAPYQGTLDPDHTFESVIRSQLISCYKETREISQTDNDHDRSFTTGTVSYRARGESIRYEVANGINFSILFRLWWPMSISDVHYHQNQTCEIFVISGQLIERRFSNMSIPSNISTSMYYEQLICNMARLKLQDDNRDPSVEAKGHDSSRPIRGQNRFIDGVDQCYPENIDYVHNLPLVIEDRIGPHQMINPSNTTTLLTMHLYYN